MGAKEKKKKKKRKKRGREEFERSRQIPQMDVKSNYIKTQPRIEEKPKKIVPTRIVFTKGEKQKRKEEVKEKEKKKDEFDVLMDNFLLPEGGGNEPEKKKQKVDE